MKEGDRVQMTELQLCSMKPGDTGVIIRADVPKPIGNSTWHRVRTDVGTIVDVLENDLKLLAEKAEQQHISKL